MPRETVEPKRLDFLPAFGSSDGGQGDVDFSRFPPQNFPEVEVGWDRRDGDVRIGLRTVEPSAGTSADFSYISVVRHMYGRKLSDLGVAMLAQMEAAGLDITTTDDSDGWNAEIIGEMMLSALEAEGPFSSWHTYLDRRGLNRLIAILKKAGAAAFGRNEW